MSGYVSVQHMSVVVHSSPGSVHMPSPPRQRRTPVLEGSQPVSRTPTDVWGRAADDVWMVDWDGRILHRSRAD
jgi:hypothetical protein